MYVHVCTSICSLLLQTMHITTSHHIITSITYCLLFKIPVVISNNNLNCGHYIQHTEFIVALTPWVNVKIFVSVCLLVNAF